MAAASAMASGPQEDNLRSEQLSTDDLRRVLDRRLWLDVVVMVEAPDPFAVAGYLIPAPMRAPTPASGVGLDEGVRMVVRRPGRFDRVLQRVMDWQERPSGQLMSRIHDQRVLLFVWRSARLVRWYWLLHLLRTRSSRRRPWHEDDVEFWFSPDAQAVEVLVGMQDVRVVDGALRLSVGVTSRGLRPWGTPGW